MADQITKSIRRIVRGMKDDPTGLLEIDDKDSIGASRGEGYVNARGEVSTSSNGSGGSDSEGGIDDSPGSDVPATEDASNNNTGGGTGGVVGGEEGVGGIDPGIGGTNTGDDDEPSSPSGDFSSFVGDACAVDLAATNSAVRVSKVTGTDPDSANPTSLSLDSQEGIEYTAPDGWDDPDTPPALPDWVLGEEWTIQAPGSHPSASDHAAKSQVKGWAAINLAPLGYSLFQDTANIVEYFTGSSPYLDSQSTFTWVRNSCTPAEADPTCPLVAPGSDDDQPSTGVCNIAYDFEAGGFKGHTRDPDCSDAQKDPSDFVIIRCEDDPTKQYRYTKLANGDTKVERVDSQGIPIPGSVTRTFDESGRTNGWYDVASGAVLE